MSLHIMIESLKTSHKISTSFHKFPRNSGRKQKKLKLKLPSNFSKKNIQIVKLRKRVPFELDFENTL